MTDTRLSSFSTLLGMFSPICWNINTEVRTLQLFWIQLHAFQCFHSAPPKDHFSFVQKDFFIELNAQCKGSHPLPNRMFFYTLCNRPLTPPPRFTQSCCEFFDMTVKKWVNVCHDKIPYNSAKICAGNVKFTLKLWQFYPSKFLFCVNFMLSEVPLDVFLSCLTIINKWENWD